MIKFKRYKPGEVRIGSYVYADGYKIGEDIIEILWTLKLSFGKFKMNISLDKYDLNKIYTPEEYMIHNDLTTTKGKVATLEVLPDMEKINGK